MDQENIQTTKKMLEYSFRKLIENDHDLIILPQDNIVYEDNNEEEQLERILHEVCINHRLAVYLEEYVNQYLNSKYKVDLEYNRCYKNKKAVIINGEKKVRRPDIIIHSRAIKNIHPQHFLIIEAKKHHPSDEDIQKIRGFIDDPDYHYQMGLAVVYNGFNPINCILFYLKNGVLQLEKLQYR